MNLIEKYFYSEPQELSKCNSFDPIIKVILMISLKNTESIAKFKGLLRL